MMPSGQQISHLDQAQHKHRDRHHTDSEGQSNDAIRPTNIFFCLV